jgi:hypothetical protein
MAVTGRLAICLALWLSAPASAGAQASSFATPYDDQPQHLWNRLHDVLFVREAPAGERFGSTELDILYWDTTQHLLTSPSREKANQVLDEFIRRHGERLVRDPMKRAILQRDLWQLFDWSANYERVPEAKTSQSQARAGLQGRLVTIIKRLALSAEAIDRLPDNSEEAEERLRESGFPQGLFKDDGPWLLVGRSDGTSAPEHVVSFGGRSVFMVFVKFPGGRVPALAYLKRLREFQPALIYTNETLLGQQTRQQGLRTNQSVPQFPAGTQWALVRRLCLVDDQGEIRASRLIESIQVRRYDAVPEIGSPLNLIQDAQTMTEFQLDRVHVPALRAVEPGERDFQFVHFRSIGVDLFEKLSAADWMRDRDKIRGETLSTCRQCHFARGILSVNAYSKFGMSAIALDISTPERETNATFEWKSAQFDWGLLNGLWRSAQ